MADWWVKSGTGGADNGTSWSNAAESLDGLLAAQNLAGGDTVYFHNTHSYLKGSIFSWTLPESSSGLIRLLSVDGGDPTGASLVDGTVGNLCYGAKEATNANAGLTLALPGVITSEHVYIHGLELSVGSGTSQATAQFNFLTSSSIYGRLTFVDCLLRINSTYNLGAINLAGNQGAVIEFIGTRFQFGHAGQGIKVNSARVRGRGCSLVGPTYPTSLFYATAGRSADVEFLGSDLSPGTNLVDVSVNGMSHKWRFFNCAIPTPTTGTHPGPGGCEVDIECCGPADGTNGADVLNAYYVREAGVVQDSQISYLTTGGSTGKQDDGTNTPWSFAMNPNSYCSPALPLYTPWIARLVDATGDKTVTVKIAHTESAVLKENEVWMEVLYMGEPGLAGTQRLADSPMGVVELDDLAHLISGSILLDALATGDDRTDTGEAWTGITSEKTHTLTASINCAEVGYVLARVGLAKDTTNQVYVDGKIGVE